MAEGEHTIISKIPRERLNGIAGRKLAALGIPVRLGADRETLEGDLAFASPVVNPLTGAPVPRARFQVVGHDHLRFLDPPLSALKPVLFYDVERSGAIEVRVAHGLQQRAALLQDLAARFRALRLEPGLDAERLLARTVVNTATHAFELLGGPEGVRVSRVAVVGGQPFDVPPEFPGVNLEEHASRTDLELWLDGLAPEMQAAARRRARPDAAREAAAARIEVTSPPRNALTLAQIVSAFGPDAVMAPNAPVEVFQEVQWAGTRYRFVATRELGTTFRGRLIGPSGDVWSDRFDLSRFPGTMKVIAAALGGSADDTMPAGAAGSPQSAPGAVAPPAVPQHLLPRPGEVWVMNVVVEQSGDEVRYVGTDIDGRPYGAARVLKRADFEAVFSHDRGGWRLLVVIDQVAEGGVVYRQLDAQRQPIGGPRRMSASILVANFIPEAAAF
ncbi:MAG TPA: hypothetical protein VFP65_22735 [Anaeromyxobacteraceae bacterium]|nr:hypothetical protein [Anaeromyxobacteraceae bacterium]